MLPPSCRRRKQLLLFVPGTRKPKTSVDCLNLAVLTLTILKIPFKRHGLKIEGLVFRRFVYQFPKKKARCDKDEDESGKMP